MNIDFPAKAAVVVRRVERLRSVGRQLVKIGIRGVTVPAETLRLQELSITGRREVRQVISRVGLEAAALRIEAGRTPLADPRFDGEALLDALRQALEAAREIGFACVACDLGRVPRMKDPEVRDSSRVNESGGNASGSAAAGDAAAPLPTLAGGLILPTASDVARITGGRDDSRRADAPPEDPTAALDVLREVAALADRVGVPLALGASLSRSADLQRLLLMADSPHFGRELDTGALLGEDVASVVVAEPPVLHVLARDAQRGDAGRMRSVPPGEGEVDWRAWQAALVEADFAGFLTLAVPLAELDRALAAVRP